MAEESKPVPQSQSNAPSKRDEKRPAGSGNTGGRGARRAPSVSKSGNGTGSANQGGNKGGGARKPSSNAPSTGSPASSAAAIPNMNQAKVGENISRPSSTDSARKRGDNRRGRGGHRGPSGNRKPSGTGPKQSAPEPVPAAPAAPEPTAEGSTALSSLQRMITDLKAVPPSNSTASSGGQTSVAPMPQGSPSKVPSAASSNLPVNAPIFRPGAAAYPGPEPANDPSIRHRKSASTGSHTGAPPFQSSLQAYAPNLGSMMEDAEDGMGHGDFEDGEIPDQSGPGFAQQPNLGFIRHTQAASQGSMGSFTAPRFAALAAQRQQRQLEQQQQQQQQQQEVLGPTGRPQLAPGFMFGARRNVSMPIASPAVGEEDANFQFPPQHQPSYNFQPDSQAPGQQSHRRTPSEMAGVSNLMAEQLALQNQIEALQQQQQQLYQQQLAQNPVMSSLTAASRPSAHRRIQSQAPMGFGMPSGGFGMGGGMMGGFGMGGSMASEHAPGGGTMPRGGHGRRHSVNVINKSTTDQPGNMNFPFAGNEGFDDGFAPPQPPAAHSRNPSRVDSSWRINGGAGAVQNPGVTADLAQAQAQLQSLQQFRAAAGGHHHKMPSFSFPNILPNMMAANLMGLGGLGLMQQQQQQFQMQLQQQSQQPQRKSLFAPYLPQASLPPLLAAGKLVVGILRVNKRNRSDAYVSTEVLDADIYICGSKDRNRALEGDIVAVELLDVDEVWGTKKEKEEKKRKKEENAAYDVKTAAGRKNDKKKDDVEVEGQGLTLFEDEEVTDEVKPQFAGHVVAVVERMPGQLFSGTLGLLRPSSAATKEKQEAERREREGDRAVDEDNRNKAAERPRIVWFKPTDKRVPLIAIPTEQAPPDFVSNPDAYIDRLFVACIKRHPISSLHPFGTLVEELGPIGDVEVETSALLKDSNFPTEEFSENVLKCLPPIPWTIPEREFEIRRDLRSQRIFTIDGEFTKDRDDALSIQTNDDGTYDVSVHIADVSYFVKPNTALDRDARKKATSVYLVQRAVPMLPPALCEDICSLNPGVDRLTFTASFTMTQDGRVLKKWFGKTIIKSAAKLSYANAQSVIDGRGLDDIEAIDHNPADIEADVKLLYSLASQMRERRFGNGTLRLQSLKLTFQLDDNGLPTDCSEQEIFNSNSLVEEFMLLANMSVAQQIAVHLPEQALLRHHKEPLERRLAGFAQRAERLGVKIDVSSAGAIQRSFEVIEDPELRRMLEFAMHKAMSRAKYFCAGMLDIAKYHHYALNAPLYTHFTSPIRRYADILVHRQLEAVISESDGEGTKFSMDRDSVAKIAQQCNIKKDSARLAQEQSDHLFLCLLVSDLTQRYGPVVRQAKVIGVLDAAFDVIVPEFGIEKRVHVDQMPIDNHVYDQHSHTLQIYWSERDVITWLAENSDDEHLKKVKQTAEQHAVKMEINSRTDESALFDDDMEDEDEVVMKRTDDKADKGKEVETSKQRILSAAKVAPQFEGLRTTPNGHRIQDIKELMSVPVIVTADLTKSPPVIKVYSVNPYASERKK